MMRDVVMRDTFSKKADVGHEVHVLTPVTRGKLIPRPADLLSQLLEPLCRGKSIAGRQARLGICRYSIPFGWNDPAVFSLGKERLRTRERNKVHVLTGDPAVGERYLNREARETEMVLDAGYTLLLQ